MSNPGEGDIVASRAEQSMSLFQLESELAELMAFRDQEELTSEERAAVDGQIAEYVKRELTKVDNLRSYMRHCAIMADAAKEEADRQSRRAASWKSRLDYLKGCCLDAMNVIGKKRLDGRTGYLISKVNGGKQALMIYDVRLVPDQFKVTSLTMSCVDYERIWQYLVDQKVTIPTKDVLVNGDAIRAAMEKYCEKCAGIGVVALSPQLGTQSDTNACAECNGTGKQQVPGARLELRGSHCEVK